MSFYFQTSSVLRNDGATGTKGCAASREDPLGQRVAPQRAADHDAAARPRQGLALGSGQSPHAVLAHRVAALERRRRRVSAYRAGRRRGGGGFFAAALLVVRTGWLRDQLPVDDRIRLAPASVDILRTGAAVVFVEVFYLGVVERGWVAHLVKARRRRAAVLFPWCGITC